MIELYQKNELLSYHDEKGGCAIDGLDEFEGDEVDHWKLSRDLQS